MSPLSLDILIVTWNRKADLIRALESIHAQPRQPRRVIVVDNGSEDGTREIVPKDFPEVLFLPQDRNLGACGGRNAGMPRVESDLVFFMDDDTELLPGCLEEIVDRFASLPNLGAIQPEILLPRPSPSTDPSPEPRPNPHPISAAWCVRTEALPVDPWPDHFIRQGEEMWVALHLYERGYESEILPSAKCLHHHAEGGQREKVFYFFTRNSFLLYYQRLPWLLALLVAPYKVLRTLVNVRSTHELWAWSQGVSSAFGRILKGEAPRRSIGWGGAKRYFSALRESRRAG